MEQLTTDDPGWIRTSGLRFRKALFYFEVAKIASGIARNAPDSTAPAHKEPTTTLALIALLCDDCSHDLAMGLARGAERERLKAAVLEFAKNKMHREWYRQLAGLFEVAP